MSDTLYLQLDQNIQINHPHIYLQDIANFTCSNSKILNRLRVMPVINLDPNKPGTLCNVCHGSDLRKSKKKNRTLKSIILEKPTLSSLLKTNPVPGLSGSGARLFSSVLPPFSVQVSLS